MPGRHVGVAVHQVDVRDPTVLDGSNLCLHWSNPRLVDEPEPDHGQDVEGVPEGEQGPPASNLPPAEHRSISAVLVGVNLPELVGTHQDDAGQDRDEEPRLLVLHTGEAQHWQQRGEHGQGKYVSHLKDDLISDDLVKLSFN